MARAPRLVVVDPRQTPVAERAEVHLPIRPGTNLPLLNGIQAALIRNGAIDTSFVAEHTVGFDRLAEVVSAYDPETVSQICGVPRPTSNAPRR